MGLGRVWAIKKLKFCGPDWAWVLRNHAWVLTLADKK